MTISDIYDLEWNSLFEKSDGKRGDYECGLDVTGAERFSNLGKRTELEGLKIEVIAFGHIIDQRGSQIGNHRHITHTNEVCRASFSV
jgi:hypothetical protein